MLRHSRPLLKRFSLAPYTILRGSIALMLVGALLCTSCFFPGGPSATQTAAAVIKQLESITDLKQRELASVYTLNTLCSLSRLAAGKADGRVETTVAPYFASKVPQLTKLKLLTFANTLEAIPTSKRAELLGGFANFDPGKCTAAPKWDEIKHSVLIKNTVVPRLRTNYCSGNFTYADGVNADRAITAASQIVSNPDGGASLLSAASPVILGVEGQHVTARHPVLQATAGNDGISPFGVATNIPCSLTNDSCDASQGLICGAKLNSDNKCIAFPVVQKDEDLIMRGFNFWDVESARMVFSPLLPGSGTESTALLNFIEANEPTDGMAACPQPSLGNPTHNRAHFIVSANEGHFYRLQMYNHNGTFLTQRDAIDNAPPRPIHICYPESVSASNVPPGTVRQCTLPVETCADDGKLCSATWATPPRKLDDCKHLPGQPVPCGETPEWFRNESLSVRQGPEGGYFSDPIVFVMRDEPKYEFRTSLAALECEDETGEWGSDEPLVFVAGFKTEIPPGAEAELLENLDKQASTWRGTKFDSNERRQIGKLLSTVTDVTSADRVLYLVALMEDDGVLDGLLGGLLVIGIGVAIALLAGAPAGIVGIIAGFATAGWTAFMLFKVGPDDLLGRTTLMVTTVDMDERIGATHANDFLTAGTTLGALPPAPNAVTEKQRANPHLIHPFVDFPLGPPLEAQCDPGPCQSGETCLVNRCVPIGFSDPTNGRGFRERREFADTDAYYVLDLLWEKVRTP